MCDMTAWKLFDGDIAHVSTAEFHADRERASHLEHPVHRPRLMHAAQLVHFAVNIAARQGLPATVSDLGCGDGGLLSLLSTQAVTDAGFEVWPGKEVTAWGYDFAPANVAGWAERGITAEFLDVFGTDRDKATLGTVTVVTEVLEHLTDPVEALKWIGGHSRFVVASSPWDERPTMHDECHAWAFDQDGYRDLLEQAGYRILRHYDVGRFQLALGMQT